MALALVQLPFQVGFDPILKHLLGHQEWPSLFGLRGGVVKGAVTPHLHVRPLLSLARTTEAHPDTVLASGHFDVALGGLFAAVVGGAAKHGQVPSYVDGLGVAPLVVDESGVLLRAARLMLLLRHNANIRAANI